MQPDELADVRFVFDDEHVGLKERHDGRTLYEMDDFVVAAAW
jgi:hypothetical protein